jgi:hypothetical protein
VWKPGPNNIIFWRTLHDSVLPRTQEAIADLRCGKYDDPAAETATVQSMLAAAGAAYDSVAADAKRFRSYEELFGITVRSHTD